MKKQYEDTEFDTQLQNLSTDFLWKNKHQQELKNRILTDMEKLQFNARRKNHTLCKKIQKRSLTVRLAYSAMGLLLLFGLLIGSAFVSPVMAEVVSKVPYLNKLFQSEPVNRVIWKELEESGYKIVGVSGNPSHILISIEGSEQYYQNIRGEVKEIAANVLKLNDYDAYTIEVKRQIDKVPSISKEEKYIDESLSEIYGELIEFQFNLLSQSYSHPSPNSQDVIIEIDVPNTENRVEEIIEIYSKKLEAKNIESSSITINKMDTVQKEKEAKWADIVHVIFSGLTAKEEFNVTDVAYAYESASLQIIVKTSIAGSKKDASQKVYLIEQTIKEFLNSREVKDKVNGEPYSIIIKSKDKQIIN